MIQSTVIIGSKATQMHASIEDWKNGWFGISVGVDVEEIDSLIELLRMIKSDPDQHFHISSNYEGDGGIGDIEVFIRSKIDEYNMSLTGRALAPGDEIDT